MVPIVQQQQQPATRRGLRPGGSTNFNFVNKIMDASDVVSDNVNKGKTSASKPRTTSTRTAAPHNKNNDDWVTGRSRNKREQHQQQQQPTELKINSRAALMADGLADSAKSSRPTGSRFSRSTSTCDVQRDTPSTRRGIYSNTSTSSSGRAFGQNTAIRREWEKRDAADLLHENKSPMEKEMESLLSVLNDADVGTLSTLSVQSPMELPDGGGGWAAGTSLSDSASVMMGLWIDHRKWRKQEARLAGRILLRMEMEEVLGDGRPVKYEYYLAVINAYAKVTAEDETAPIRAENILDHMAKRATEGRMGLKTDRLCINTAMGAHAKSTLCGTLNMRNISAAERMLDTLERDFASGDKTMQPTARTYSKIIDAYAKHGRADEAARALERMETQYRDGNKAARPRTIHYTNVIDAFAKSAGRSSRAALTAEEVLRSMLDLYEKGDYHLAPDAVVFSATIDAWSKSGRPDAPEHSLGILDLMDQFQVVPDIVTYNIVLNTLALSNDPYYLRKAEDILRLIEQSSTVKADSFTYNALLKGLPPADAEKLIQHWEMEYKRGRTDERPDSFTYVSLMKAWTKSNVKGFEEQCVKILDWMEKQEVVGMNRITYNEVIKACSRSHRDDAGDIAEAVFKRLVARYERGRDREMKTDKYSYMSLLNAHARSCNSFEGALKAEGVLFEMIDRCDLPTPDSKLCNSVVSAWARSGHNDAAVRAERIFDRMDSVGIEIDGVVYNSLINVYSKSCDSDKSKHALAVLNRMHERRVDPTSVTYSLLIDACVGDEKRLNEVFEDCTRKGMLDERLENSFLHHGPASVQEQLHNIPREWSRNANRGPAGISRNKIKHQMKRGRGGADIQRFGWAR